MKINSLAALKKWSDSVHKDTSFRITILACAGTSCLSSESDLIIEMLQAKIDEHKLNGEVLLKKVGCLRFCGEGPIMFIEPDNITYVRITIKDVDEIFTKHILEGTTITRLLYQNKQKEVIERYQDMNFYKKQLRIALRNVGDIDPRNIDEYIAQDGYKALGQSLLEMTPEDVVQIVKDSGLRGRGGGGFPTGLKWAYTAAVKSNEKYVICNADEGDPGAFMDRSIIEGDPHSLIEAMTLAGYAIGSNQGYIYIRAEYAISLEPLKIALAQAKESGFLGDNIFGTDFSFDIGIKLGAGAFVCGEETALIRSMEGHRGEPDKKPPYPSESGFRGKPTSVNNVETFVNVPAIILNGADWFASYGTERSKGTKVFALAGNVKNIGLVEVPMGITLREIIYDIGGGHPEDKKIKAVQIGGPSGGVITEEYFDTPIDYDSLLAIGAMMGSGGLIVMDEDSDMVEIAKFYLDFTQDESCGKCTPCRIGTKRMFEILERLTNMEGEPADLERLETLGYNIKNASLCGLGQTAPNPVLSTMEFFREEYEAYAYRTKRTSYQIEGKKCIGCTKCARVCPVDCISGNVREVHTIDEAACIACGACYEACPVDAILKP